MKKLVKLKYNPNHQLQVVMLIRENYKATETTELKIEALEELKGKFVLQNLMKRL